MEKPRPPKSPATVPEGSTPAIPTALWPIDKPIDYPKNARKWSQKAIDKVAKSLQEFGFRQPIVVDAKGVIIIGHLRRAAARTIGLETVPVHVASDLSPAQVRQLRLMDNRSHDEAEWDLDILAEEMKELAALDLDLSLTGFDPSEYGEKEGDGAGRITDSVLGNLEYRIIVDCDSENEQTFLLQRFESEGLTCRLLIS